MSRAKTTKRAKEYSRIHLYRHFEELSNHAKNVLTQQDTRSTPTPPTGDQKIATDSPQIPQAKED